MEHRHDEFKQLEAKALAILSASMPPDDSHLRSLIRLHVEPAFGNFTSWYVFADKEERTFILRKTVWQRPFDAQRFTHPMFGLKHGWHIAPTMDITRSVIAAEAMQALLAEARNMLAPDPNVRKGITLDGMPCSLFAAGAFDSNEYAWNAIAVPQGWAQMAAWVERLLVVLNTASAG
jgi:hypothetical protein